MKRGIIAALALIPLALFAVAVGSAFRSVEAGRTIPLKEAKLNIEHNATDEDTGFQGPSTARAGGTSPCAGRTARC